MQKKYREQVRYHMRDWTDPRFEPMLEPLISEPTKLE